MCTGFTTDVIWINTICAVSLANHLRGVADSFCPLRTENLRGELHKDEVLLIAYSFEAFISWFYNLFRHWEVIASRSGFRKIFRGNVSTISATKRQLSLNIRRAK